MVIFGVKLVVAHTRYKEKVLSPFDSLQRSAARFLGETKYVGKARRTSPLRCVFFSLLCILWACVSTFINLFSTRKGAEGALGMGVEACFGVF